MTFRAAQHDETFAFTVVVFGAIFLGDANAALENEAEFIAEFDATFVPEVVRMILKCPRTGLYCDSRGVMIFLLLALQMFSPTDPAVLRPIYEKAIKLRSSEFGEKSVQAARTMIDYAKFLAKAC